MSAEIMTAQGAFDEYVRRRVTERNKQREVIEAWAGRCEDVPTGWSVTRHPPPAPKHLERDVEIRAIQLGID